MERQPGIEGRTNTVEYETSYDLARLIRVSSAASLIAWFFALVGAIGVALAIYWAYLAVDVIGLSSGLVSFAMGFVGILFMLLLCFASSIVMRAVSEGVMVLRDIEENTRPRAELAGARPEGIGASEG